MSEDRERDVVVHESILLAGSLSRLLTGALVSYL